jgi:hypothetical protein
MTDLERENRFLRLCLCIAVHECGRTIEVRRDYLMNGTPWDSKMTENPITGTLLLSPSRNVPKDPR